MSAPSRKWFRFRIATLLATFLVLFCVLVVRAFHLQIMTGKTYKNLAEQQHKKALQLHLERGIIFDRNGEKLAASILADSVFADPSKIDNVDATLDTPQNVDAGDLELVIRVTNPAGADTQRIALHVVAGAAPQFDPDRAGVAVANRIIDGFLGNPKKVNGRFAVLGHTARRIVEAAPDTAVRVYRLSQFSQRKGQEIALRHTIDGSQTVVDFATEKGLEVRPCPRHQEIPCRHRQVRKGVTESCKLRDGGRAAQTDLLRDLRPSDVRL